MRLLESPPGVTPWLQLDGDPGQTACCRPRLGKNGGGSEIEGVRCGGSKPRWLPRPGDSLGRWWVGGWRAPHIQWAGRCLQQVSGWLRSGGSRGLGGGGRAG